MLNRLLPLALLVAVSGAGAQSIADRVARVGDGTVRMSFAARPGICGRGTTIVRGRNSTMNWGSDWDRYGSRDVEWDDECEHGPVRLVLDVRDHEVAALRVYVGGRWRPAREATTDLGTVPAREAGEFLLRLADRGTSRVAKEAVFPATLADSITVWPALIRLARNEERPRDVRTNAVFWLGQAAGEVATAQLDDIVRDDGVDREVRKQAVFALSQRPRDEGIPALIRVAKTSRDPEVRKQALFWLGQSNDPRAIDVFEEILTRR